MSALVAPPITPAPLTELTHGEREQVIAALTTQLAPTDAVTVLTALAGSPDEVNEVPLELQELARRAIMHALPPATNVIVMSRLGIGLKSDEAYLEEILTEQERADPVFRRRVEDEAKRRGIQRWLAVMKLRHAHMSLDELAATVDQHPRERAPENAKD